MAGSGNKKRFDVPVPDRQVAFHEFLVAARKTWLKDGLSDALRGVDPEILKNQLSALVPRRVQQLLASAGIRDEYVFPTPVILETKPTLVGYYRLLLGVSQKSFYGTGTGLSIFKSTETNGLLAERQKEALPEFCEAMAERLADLVTRLSPTVTQRDVEELPLLTIGSQFQGGNNNVIGQQAIVDVFLAIAEVLNDHIVSRSHTQLVVVNAAGRTVSITLASDPDVRIEEEFGSELRKKVALEVKGGTDRSNAHNRAGEAEKSHQKARNDGFRDFWTLITMKGLDVAALKAESPTTNSWFDAAQILAREGTYWEDFSSRLAGEVGIPIA